jgi:hypothetical protein
VTFTARFDGHVPIEERVCGRVIDRTADEFYDDTCLQHPTGCHMRMLGVGQEYHDRPAYRYPPLPGQLEAEAFDALIEAQDLASYKLRRERLNAGDTAFADAANTGLPSIDLPRFGEMGPA